MKTLGMVLEHRIINMVEVLEIKKDDYGRVNRYQTFINAGEGMNCSPVIAALGMAVKHFESCCDIHEEAVKRMNEERYRDYNDDHKEEKFGDAFNYNALMLGMLDITQDVLPCLKSNLEYINPENLSLDETTILKDEYNLSRIDMHARLRDLKAAEEVRDYTAMRKRICDLILGFLIVELRS